MRNVHRLSATVFPSYTGLELIDLAIQCGEGSEINVPDGQLGIPGSGLFQNQSLGPAR